MERFLIAGSPVQVRSKPPIRKNGLVAQTVEHAIISTLNGALPMKQKPKATNPGQVAETIKVISIGERPGGFLLGNNPDNDVR